MLHSLFGTGRETAEIAAFPQFSFRGRIGLKRYLILAGNIGAGKSTLVERLCARLDWKPYYEPVETNPYLEDFYTDMKRWAFPSQMFFLSHRARSHMELAKEPHSVVQDRSLYEDAHVFARNLYLQGYFSERDHQTYNQLYNVISQLLPPPDLVVYLRASVPTLQSRIRLRARSYEQDIAPSYLEGLNKLYDEWISSFTLAPVLTIDGDQVDFVANPAETEHIVARIETALKSKQGTLF